MIIFIVAYVLGQLEESCTGTQNFIDLILSFENSYPEKCWRSRY